MTALHFDKDVDIIDAGVYSVGTGKDSWQDVTPAELRAMLEGDSPPMFRTALAKTCEDIFAGAFYVDIDGGDTGEAIQAFQTVLAKLEALGLDLMSVRLFASGYKGFHAEVPAACFMAEPSPVQGLPRVFKEMALELYVDGLDLRVYSGGRGRLWRVANIRRDNGLHKVPVAPGEVRAMTAERYAELCSEPRPFPTLAAPELCPGLARLFVQARDKVAAKVSRARKWSQAETALRERFNGNCPPSFQRLLRGEVAARQGFNEVALQLSLLAHALGWDEDRTITECAGLIANHGSDGHRYNTPAKRENEQRRMFAYTEGNAAYSFSVAGLRSILPPGSRSPDLQGLEADEGDDTPDYAELLDAVAGDAGAVVAVARQVVADPSLSRTEAEALVKRAAKSAGVATKVLRADLWQPDEAGEHFIDVVRADFAASVDSAMAALSLVPSIRVRAGQLVEVGDGRFAPVALPRLAYLLSSVARWRYPDGIGGPDAMALQGVLAAGRWPGVQEVVGIARQPTILAGGAIGVPEGFEADYRPEDFPPYQGSGADALAELRGLLAEFPFASEADEAAALAAILTAVARPALRTAPGFLVTAHDLGSGKSFLAELTGLFATPDVQMMRWAQRSEEQDKLLLSLLMEGRPVCVFDNLMRDWVSPTLAAILTAPTYSDRLLGASEAVQVSTRCLWVATGNNVRAAQDLSRRVVTIELDPRCENPTTREFSGNPVSEVRANRGRRVMCALHVLQAFLESGERPKLTPLASFDEWSALIRGALVAHGLPDLAGGVVAQVEGDDDRALLGFVLEVWHEAFGDEPMTLREVLQAMQAGGDRYRDLRALFEEVAGERGDVNIRTLGYWFREQAGRVVGGMRLVQFGKPTRAGVAWQVVRA